MFDRKYRARLFVVDVGYQARTLEAIDTSRGKARLAVLAMAKDYGYQPVARATTKRVQ